MNDHELNRERRRQRVLERLGSNTPRCLFCGIDEPLVLELHHVAGRGYDPQLVTACRNCHRILSDRQKERLRKISTPPSELERIGQFLLGLADIFEILVKRLREFAEKLFELANESHHENEEMQP
jgi:hypothetical protein